MLRAVLCAIAAGTFVNITSAAADQANPIAAEQYIDEAFLNGIRAWMSNPILAVTLKGQNKLHTGMSSSQITQLDDQWRREREADDQPLISATLSSPLSIYLTRIQAQSTGVFAEIIVTDNRGLNAGQSSITGDYWQGDEDKFQKTYDVGPDAVFIDKPEYNEATKSWRVQVNMTVVDPNSKEKLGAATVEVNLTELQRRATS